MLMVGRTKLILASGSPRRLSLINQVGITPDHLLPADIDELPLKGELPRACANRLARVKAETALAHVRRDEELKGSYILAADTVVAVGRRILPKAELVDDANQCLRLLSGRNHKVYTAVCLVTPKEGFRQRMVETRVRFKRLSEEDLDTYLASGPMARQGRRLCGAGHCRLVHRQAGRLLHQCGRPAALRNRDLARRRRVPDPRRLGQRAGADRVRRVRKLHACYE